MHLFTHRHDSQVASSSGHMAPTTKDNGIRGRYLSIFSCIQAQEYNILLIHPRSTFTAKEI